MPMQFRGQNWPSSSVTEGQIGQSARRGKKRKKKKKKCSPLLLEHDDLTMATQRPCIFSTLGFVSGDGGGEVFVCLFRFIFSFCVGSLRKILLWLLSILI